MSGDGAEDGRDLSERLKRLGAQLERKAPQATSRSSSRPGSTSGVSPMGQAMRLSTEFVGGVVAGGAIGWVFDYLAGTKPWGLMVWLMLGFLTGIYNVMRASGFVGPTIGTGSRKNGPEGP